MTEEADLNKTDTEREVTVFLINGADFRQETPATGVNGVYRKQEMEGIDPDKMDTERERTSGRR